MISNPAAFACQLVWRIPTTSSVILRRRSIPSNLLLAQPCVDLGTGFTAVEKEGDEENLGAWFLEFTTSVLDEQVR